MRSALRMSSNRAAVQMLNTIGIPSAVTYAQKLNVGTPPSVPSLALGASDVTLLSLTAAYGAFANGGIVRTPVLIRRVEDSDGKVLYQDAGKSQRAVSEATAFLMSSMLADVINAGTAYKARQAGFTLPAAGKTGTTNDYVDAWFVGFTPHLVTGVWVGFDQPKPIVSNGYAGELAVPIWGGFMKVATKGHKPDWFERPANVVGVNVCRVSGKLPNYGCSNVGYARRGRHPRDEVDGLHRLLREGHRARNAVPGAREPVHRRAGRLGIGIVDTARHPGRRRRPRDAAAAARAGDERCHRPDASRQRAGDRRQGRGPAAEEERFLGPPVRPRRQGQAGRREERRREEAQR